MSKTEELAVFHLFTSSLFTLAACRPIYCSTSTACITWKVGITADKTQNIIVHKVEKGRMGDLGKMLVYTGKGS